MNKKETKKGTIIKRHPYLHDIKLEDGTEIKAYCSGKMRKYNIRILVGDRVKVEIPGGSDKGRIIYRFNQ